MSNELPIDRRAFLKTVAGTVAAGGLAGPAARAAEDAGKPLPPTRPIKIRKAVKFGMVKGDLSIRDKFQMLKDLGFDGVEMSSPDALDRNEVLAARDQTGLPIHGVVNTDHWKKPLSHPDPAVRAECVESLKTALRDAKLYGGSSVLLVPAVVNKEIAYADAYQRSQGEIRKLLPLAEQLDIRILIENVWNNFLLSPLEMARFIDELDSPLVGSYFDVGNIVRSGWPEHWIQVLGKRIVKLDIKEYSRKKRDKEGLWKGFDVELLEGDCDWPVVMKTLRGIGFNGWATAEIPGGDRERLADIARRMDRIFAS